MTISTQIPPLMETLLAQPCIVQTIILLSVAHFAISISKPLASQISLFLEFVFSRPPKLSVPLTEAEAIDDGIQSEPLSHPQLQIASEPDKIQCWDPSTLQHLGTVPAMDREQVDILCRRAAEAQKSWCQTTYAQRRMVLRTIQQYILEHQEDICRVCARDSGKPKVDALLGEVMTTCEKIRCINQNGEEWLQRSYRPVGPMMIHKTAYVEYVPYGVLGVIAPWNYPFHNMLNHVISGLFSGNAVVSKVSEYTSWSAAYFTRIVKAALEVNGHNSDVVQTLTGLGQCGEALVQSPFVDKIIFTGSPAVGRKVMSGCAPHLKPCVLELGGKDPMVFCDDVKMEDVVPWAMRGCFQNCGQNCCGVERLFVYESIQSKFLSAVVPKVKALRQGVPNAVCGNDGNVDCGAMIMPAQLDIIEALVKDAVDKGAKLHCGGKRNTSSSSLNGQFFEPTVLSGITSKMRIYREEVFGPVMCVITVPNDSDDECIRLVNDCEFGLGASVYSASQRRAVKIGSAIRSGMVTINDFGVSVTGVEEYVDGADVNSLQEKDSNPKSTSEYVIADDNHCDPGDSENPFPMEKTPSPVKHGGGNDLGVSVGGVEKPVDPTGNSSLQEEDSNPKSSSEHLIPKDNHGEPGDSENPLSMEKTQSPIKYGGGMATANDLGMSVMSVEESIDQEDSHPKSTGEYLTVDDNQSDPEDSENPLYVEKTQSPVKHVSRMATVHDLGVSVMGVEESIDPPDINSSQEEGSHSKSTSGHLIADDNQNDPEDSENPFPMKKTQSPFKHVIATCGFSVTLMLMIFAYLRIGMHAFCTYDQSLKTYIIIEKVEQCPVPIEEKNNNFCPFWKKCAASTEDLVKYVPAPVGKMHETVCRELYQILHLGATILHPSVPYEHSMPRVEILSPCPKIPPPSKKNGGNILLRFFKRNKAKDEVAKPSKDVKKDGDFDWTLFVSEPLTLNLSAKQLAIAKKVTQNLRSNLGAKYPDFVNHQGWFERKVEQVPFGGKYSWWHPSKDKWGDDKEDSGLRLVTSYLKIMKWPETLSTNFPYSGICENGCAADFAISNTLEFREQYKPWKITPSVLHENRKGWIYVRGYSPTRYHPDPAVGGASVLWMKPGLHKMEDPESFSRAVMNALETCIADALIRSDGRIAKCNIMLDCDDVGLSKIPPIGPTKRTLKMLQDHYPDKLGTFAIFNLSGASQMFLKVLLPLLPDVVRQKIHIIPNDNDQRSTMLHELLDKQFIPIQFGGTDSYIFSADEYYKNGRYKSDMMTDEEGIRYYNTIPYYAP